MMVDAIFISILGALLAAVLVFLVMLVSIK